MTIGKKHVMAVLGLGAVLGLAVWTYWGCLQNPFHFDDVLFLENPLVTDPGDPLVLLRPTQIRQLTYLSFLANYRLSGTRPEAYHAVNLLLHIVNIIGVWILARLLFQEGILPDHRFGGWLPLASAGIFALHPIQSEPVNYVYQRSVMWAAFFSIAAICIFIDALRRNDSRAHQVFVGIAFLLAVAGKESALTLPLVLLVYLYSHASSFGEMRVVLRRMRWLFMSTLGIMLAGVAWTLYLLYHFRERTAGLAMLDIHPLRYLGAEMQVILVYLRMLFWPTGLSVDHAPVIEPFGSIHAIACDLLVLGLIATSLWIRRHSPTASFLSLSFFCLLAPTSSIVPSADLMFEHRLYLPMIAAAPLFALALAKASQWIARSLAVHRVVASIALVSILGASAAGSRERTRIWGDNVRLWSDATGKAPGKARAHYNLGVSYLAVDRVRAREELQKALELRPNHAPALYNLGWLEQSHARYDSARSYYLKALKADPGYWQAHHNLGNLDVLQGRHEEALLEFQVTVRLKQSYWPAWLSLGTLQLQLGRYAAAKESLMTLRTLRPDLQDGRWLLAYALTETGEIAEARDQLRVLESKDHDGIYRERIAQLRQRMEVLSK